MINFTLLADSTREQVFLSRLLAEHTDGIHAAIIADEVTVFARYFSTPSIVLPSGILPKLVQPAVVAPVVITSAVVEPLAPELSLYQKLKKGLQRTRQGFTGGMLQILQGKVSLDAQTREALETQLLMADVGLDASQKILQQLSERLTHEVLKDAQQVRACFEQILFDILQLATQTQLETANLPAQPYVVLFVGVNGVGKTTTIGKLAKRLQQNNHSVMLAAGDTFRAAAVEQLKIWGERNQVPVIAQETGADSASVIFDALSAAQARGVDVLIADTAGRLHNKSNLMEELKKVKRVLQKLSPQAPHEIILVIDASTGQNALNQVQEFHQAVGLTSIALTKLDGTAKGGVVFAIYEKFGLPVSYIGMGEQLDDLRPFEARAFVQALCAQE